MTPSVLVLRPVLSPSSFPTNRTHYFRIAGSLGRAVVAMVLVSAWLLLAGCDTAVDVPVDSTEPTDRIASEQLAVRPVPEGMALTNLRRASELEWRVQDPSKIDPARQAALGPAPAHGCYLAQYHAGPEIKDDYRHAFISLGLPASLIAESEGNDAIVEYVAYAPNSDLLNGLGNAPPILRKAVCRIPQAKAARALLMDQLGIEAALSQDAADHTGDARQTSQAFGPGPQHESGVLPGHFENEDGFTCPEGYD